jgi:radical SAM superfamily enzyme YgiQ (UPF0313 family)
MKIRKIQLISLKPSVGRGANDGSFYPIGLLTLTKAVGDFFPQMEITINDQCHKEIRIDTDTDLVGISIPTPLCYEPAVEIAKKAKRLRIITVAGGPYITHKYQQIMEKRNVFDFLIRGKGEIPFALLIHKIDQRLAFDDAPSLSWQNENGDMIHNPIWNQKWNYDNFTRLPFYKLSTNIERYWETFRQNINRKVYAAFPFFTHFGCEFRYRQEQRGKNFCCFCSLDDCPSARDPEKILREIEYYVSYYSIPKNSRVHLKCYGDNIGQHFKLAKSLADEIEKCRWWKDYKISWTFYCQSSFASQKLLGQLKRIGTTEIFIGFDGVNDEVQKANGLGTNKKNHLRAVDLCLKNGIKIQAASIVGLIGETPKTLVEQYSFFKELSKLDIIERINSAVIIVTPGSPAYEMLSKKEPWIQEQDFVPAETLQELWIKHFCPEVDLSLLKAYANRIDSLSPGPHACMGYNK